MITKEHDKEIPKERHTSLQKKDGKLLTIWDWYNSIIMEYQKIIDLLDDKPNQPSNCKTKFWVEINDESRGMYNEDNVIRS